MYPRILACLRKSEENRGAGAQRVSATIEGVDVTRGWILSVWQAVYSERVRKQRNNEI